MLYFISFFIGGLLSTYLVSRLVLFIGSKICGKKMYVLGNSVTLLLVSALYGWGSIEKYPDYSLAFMTGLTLYAVPQFVCLAIDFVKFQKSVLAGENAEKETDASADSAKSAAKKEKNTKSKAEK